MFKHTSDSHLIDEVKLQWIDTEPMQLKYGALDDESEVTGGDNSTCEWSFLGGIAHLL